MSPQSSGLVPGYVTKIELGQIGATLVLPVSLHSDKFVAGGEKLVSRLGNWSRPPNHQIISVSVRTAPVLPSELILVLGVVRNFFSSRVNTERKTWIVICLLCLRLATAHYFTVGLRKKIIKLCRVLVLECINYLRLQLPHLESSVLTAF